MKQAHGFKGNSETCISCSTLICRVCKTVKDAAAFASPMLQSFKKRKCNVLRCNACHTCEKCERVLRACSFESTSATCKRCVSVAFESEQSRAAAIRQRLAAKEAWRCTCGKRVHDQRCQLHATHSGERRWRGTNVGVSMDDLELIDRLAKRRKF